MNKQEIGQLGEDAAADLLISKGYKILDRNFRAGRLEIDIVALKDNFLVFVEVKTRDEHFLYSPESAVNRRKQSNIISAARFYIGRFKRTEEARLDVITVLHKNGVITDIKHYERAYFPRPRRF
jgi:putative endonuclease